MDYIYRLHYGRIFGVPLRGDAVLYWLDLVCLEKLSFYALDGIMVEIGLLLAGWDGWTRWDGGGTGVGWREFCYQAPERERHHWLLRGGGQREVVADTSCIGDARARIIFVRSEK